MIHWFREIYNGVLSTYFQPQFDRAMEFVFKWEGGYVDDPRDAGGETKYGISKRAHPDLDIKSLTKPQAKKIYKEKYWYATGCHKLPWPLSMVQFDAAVNVGPHRARKLKDKADHSPDPIEYAVRIIAERNKFYRGLAKRVKFRPFLKGWLNRTADLVREIKDG